MHNQSPPEEPDENAQYRLAFQYQRRIVAFCALRALIAPLAMVAMPYFVKHLAAGDPELWAPDIWLDISIYAGWLSMALGLLSFGPGLLRDIVMLRMLTGEMKRKGIPVIWLDFPAFDPSPRLKRYVSHSLIAMGLSAVGYYVEGPLGMLFKAAGLGGVAVLGFLMATTGEGVIGKHGRDS